MGGDLGAAAALLDRALETADGAQIEDPIVLAALFSARLRVAELMGQTELAATLAARRLTTEKDAGVAAALAMRIAEQAASQGDGVKALEALSRAAEHDPACAPARALQLDLLADSANPGAFPAQLESLSDLLETDEAKGRAFLLSAYYWALRADDVDAAKAALSQAAMYGTPPATVSRLSRTFASIKGDDVWYDEATRRLIASGALPEEVPQLWFELVRARLLRGDAEGARKALAELGSTPGGEWLGRALEAFLPGETSTQEARTAALEQLAALEQAPEMARALTFAAALAAPPDVKRQKLRDLAAAHPDQPLLAATQIECDRLAGDIAGAAAGAEKAARASTDPQYSAALLLEAGFTRWQLGDKKAALEAFQLAAESAPDALKVVLGWAERGARGDSIEAKRSALEHALEGGGEKHLIALERFAVEIGAGGDEGDAAAALGILENEADGDRGLAAALARLLWPQGAMDPPAVRNAIGRIAASGDAGAAFAAAEKLRVSRDDDLEEAADAAQAWYDAGGGTAAALEMLATVRRLGHSAREVEGMRALASSIANEDPLAAEQLRAGAAVRTFANGGRSPMLAGDTAATRLANLELAPPGSDPRRRAAALTNLGDTLGEEARVDALSLAAWSLLAGGELDAALEAFRTVVEARPNDVAAWEGLRTAGEASGNATLHAQAAQELGARCAQPERGAAFWEEAAQVWLKSNDTAAAEAAFQHAFQRDPKRGTAFDKLFRRVRDRKDNAQLLELITNRLGHAEDPAEVVKLYWEQARALRESGEPDRALEALEHVTMLEPEHVGALALSGEIFIRRGRFAEAADKLAALARLDAAPTKNRLTAGVAAVDLYENKLSAHDKAAEILLVLHRAGLSTLPVRERLAKAAARTNRWRDATEILEQLMNERADADGRIEAAKLALAIHREKLENVAGGAAAAVKLLTESPGDPEGLDAILLIDVQDKRGFLERGRTATLGAMLRGEISGDAAARLSRIARGLADPALEHAAATVAIALGQGADLQNNVAQLAARKPRVPQVRLTGALLPKLIASGDEGALPRLFAMLGPTLREALGPSLDALGVGKRDRVDPRAGLGLRNELAAWAGAFGIDEFELYVGGRDPQGVQGVPGEPHAIVVGPQVNVPLSPQLRARIGRELWALVRGTTVLRFRDETSIAAIVVAACHLAEVPINAPSYAVLGEIEKSMKSAIARKTRKAIAEVCSAVVSSGVDPIAWSRSALTTQARAAVIASGDLPAALAEMGIAPQDPRAVQLARFVLSPDYIELRRALGLEVG
jgi:tetratricopeptide (TPR) repeat protein